MVTGVGVKASVRMQTQLVSESVAQGIDADSPAFLRLVADLVPGIVYVFNRETMSNEYSNRSIADMLGYSSQEAQEMGDAFLPSIMYPEDLQKIGQHFESLQSCGPNQVVVFEYRVTAKNGEMKWLRSWESVFERKPDGTVLRHIGVAFDITAQKEAEARLKQYNLELEERVQQRTVELERLNQELEDRVAQRTAEIRDINRELEQLTYIATHDLKVPINNMISLTHMLKEAQDTLSPDHVETLDWMQEVSEQAAEKLSALVSVAQAKTGTIAPFEPVDMAAVTERVLVNLHYRVSEARAVVRARFEVPVLEFMPREMENIVEAALTNALAYRAPERRCRIEVGTRPAPDAVELYVRDNGTGLDLPRDAEKVFGLFKRAHASPNGAGVALYAIRCLLDRIGGEISVENNDEAGVCFVMTFPRPTPKPGVADERA